MSDVEPTAIPCPFTYANGRQCKGHVVRVEAYKADVSWTRHNGWKLECGPPRSHYHLFCSEKGNHAGVRRQDAVKLWPQHMPDGLLKAMYPDD
jgi:hypothetical protein